MEDPVSGSPAAGWRLARAAILLGIGLGGFVDGIVLHQILQWHHMISSTTTGAAETIVGLEANTLADGLFHAATWSLTVIGLWLLWRETSRGRVPTGREFLGWVILGWGAFNIVDEVLFHALLDLHHIREADSELLYDMVFLGIGLAQVAVGAAMTRKKHDPAASPG